MGLGKGKGPFRSKFWQGEGFLGQKRGFLGHFWGFWGPKRAKKGGFWGGPKKAIFSHFSGSGRGGGFWGFWGPAGSRGGRVLNQATFSTVF